jgi:hypothetical protein
MDEKKISEEDFMNVLKYGRQWHSKKIKEELQKSILLNLNSLNHDFRYDSDDKIYYIYDNECYLFIFDDRIDIRSDRVNVFSYDKTFTYQINEEKDVLSAYDHFKSLTMEGEDEDEDD